MSEKWLYIPVEVKVRELQGKLLLAAAAAQRGYKVVIGRKAELLDLLPCLPRGVFLGMWAQKNFSKLYQDLKVRGFCTAVMDEEGLVTFSDDIYRSLRLDDETLSAIDLFFTWGSYQNKMVRGSTPEKMPKIVETGNIRLDVMREPFRALLAAEVEALRQRYGRFILVVSSFGLSNHFDGAEAYFKALVKNQVVRTDADEKVLRAYMVLQQRVFGSLMEAIPALARAYPDYTIIARPHPSEDFKVWEQVAAQATNVKIVHEGNIQPWLLAAEADIHHFCTSALESYVGDVPSIAYRPFKDTEIESDVPYRASLEADGPESLVMAVRAAIEDEDIFKNLRVNARPFLKDYICNLDGSYGFENILDALQSYAPVAEKNFWVFDISKIRLRGFLRKIYRVTKKVVLQHQNYVDHKFSELSRAEMQRQLKILQNVLPQERPIHLIRLNDFCYMLSDEGSS